MTIAFATATCTLAVLAFAVILSHFQDRAKEAQELAQHRRRSVHSIQRALDDATQARDRAKRSAYRLVAWTEARAAARRAKELFSDDLDDPELAFQVARVCEEIERGEEAARRLVAESRLLVALEEARLRKSEVKNNRFDFAQAAPAYEAAFREYGIDIPLLSDGDAVAQLQHCRPEIHVALAAALVDWSISCRDARGDSNRLATRLIQVAQKIDPDAWRTRFRDALLKGDGAAIRQLAHTIKLEESDPATVFLLAKELEAEQQIPLALDLLGKALVRFPNDFWLNHETAQLCLRDSPLRLDDAIRFHAVAVGLRPQSPGARLNLGYVLLQRGHYRESADQTREAIRLKPDYADAYNNLGVDLMQLSRLDEAVKNLRRAVEIDPEHDRALVNLTEALLRKGEFAAAIKAHEAAVKLAPNAYLLESDFAVTLLNYGQLPQAEKAARRAIKLNSKFATGHFILGNILAQRRDETQAAECYREAIRLDPTYPEAHCNLGHSLAALGHFAEAYEAITRGHGLGQRKKGWNYPSSQWVKEIGDLLELDKRWTQYVEKKTEPTKLDDLLSVARFGLERKREAAAALALLATAFRLDPTLATGPRNPHRTRAIEAVLQIQSTGGINPADLPRWRNSALSWLQADFKDWRNATGKQRATAVREIGVLLRSAEFKPLRDPQELAKLRAAKRDAWTRFWTELRALQGQLAGAQ